MFGLGGFEAAYEQFADASDDWGTKEEEEVEHEYEDINYHPPKYTRMGGGFEGAYSEKRAMYDPEEVESLGSWSKYATAPGTDAPHVPNKRARFSDSLSTELPKTESNIKTYFVPIEGTNAHITVRGEESSVLAEYPNAQVQETPVKEEVNDAQPNGDVVDTESTGYLPDSSIGSLDPMALPDVGGTPLLPKQGNSVTVSSGPFQFDFCAPTTAIEERKLIMGADVLCPVKGDDAQRTFVGWNEPDGANAWTNETLRCIYPEVDPRFAADFHSSVGRFMYTLLRGPDNIRWRYKNANGDVYVPEYHLGDNYNLDRLGRMTDSAVIVGNAFFSQYDQGTLLNNMLTGGDAVVPVYDVKRTDDPIKLYYQDVKFRRSQLQVAPYDKWDGISGHMLQGHTFLYNNVTSETVKGQHNRWELDASPAERNMLPRPTSGVAGSGSAGSSDSLVYDNGNIDAVERAGAVHMCLSIPFVFDIYSENNAYNANLPNVVAPDGYIKRTLQYPHQMMLLPVFAQMETPQVYKYEGRIYMVADDLPI
mmetsp:Transcript_40003/g.103441  ORF Transcript_40003/g.103441 Transcript_40003/m.103441 type:complete len:535 (-) Transcript_40003:6402-8006(-)